MSLYCLVLFSAVRKDFLLTQVKATAEAEIKMLNKRVLEAEVKMSDAKSEATTAVQTQNALQRRFENLQNKLEQNAADEEQRRLHMQVRFVPSSVTSHIFAAIAECHL